LAQKYDVEIIKMVDLKLKADSKDPVKQREQRRQMTGMLTSQSVLQI